MLSKDLIRILHRKAAFAELCKFVMEHFLGMDGAAPQVQVLSEEVPYQDRFVSEDAWLEILTMLQQLALHEQAEAAQFRVVRATDLGVIREKAIAAMSGAKVSDESEATANGAVEDDSSAKGGEDDAEDEGSISH